MQFAYKHSYSIGFEISYILESKNNALITIFICLIYNTLCIHFCFFYVIFFVYNSERKGNVFF
jgi:hypothetical protein